MLSFKPGATFLSMPCQMLYKPTTMTKKLPYIICTAAGFLSVFFVQAQDTLRRVIMEPGRPKPIPDKVFEFGIPLLLVFIVVNAITSIFKIKAEVALRQKALDKGISETTLLELFREDKQMLKNVYLKWFLILAAVGISLMYVHFLDQFTQISSGYLSMGVIALLVSVAFLIYYRIIRNQR